MRRFALLALAAFFSGPAVAAAPPIWEGRVYVTAVTSQCAAVYEFVGDSFTSVFRPKLLSTDPKEGLSIVYPRAASVLVSTAPNGMLVNGVATKTNFHGTLVNIFASPKFWDTTATLVKQPATITATTPTVTITGTIDDFNTLGCTITIRGAYTRRP